MAFSPRRKVVSSLKKYQIRPRKVLGQHFLIDKEVLRKIVKVANLKTGDIILEIGPGTGILTEELAKRVKKVIAVEKDLGMIAILRETIKNFKNVKIIQGDILKIPKHKLPTTNYKIVANLPYYIVAPVIRKFLELIETRPLIMILMVQKEVAQRICAKPPRMSLLSVSVQFYAKPEIISYVSKKSFWPQPKVNSAILKIVPRKSALLSASIRERFFRIAKAGFSQPRKQLLNNLSRNLKINREKITTWLLKNKIKPYQRAENLGLKEWIRLTKTFDFE